MIGHLPGAIVRAAGKPFIDHQERKRRSIRRLSIRYLLRLIQVIRV